jgi:3-methyladenine DNA glycosylase/8-oxoguanine DNA glycosylase
VKQPSERRVSGELRPKDGTPLDLDLVVRSHGWWDLPPFEYDREKKELRFVLASGGRSPAMVTITRSGPGAVRVAGRGVGVERAAVMAAAKRVLDLDADLSGFHELCRDRGDGFAWIARRGAGRMLRAPSLFEDAVKVLATTNCTWAVTRNVVKSLIAIHDNGGAFPDASFLAGVPEARLKSEARLGYRAPYLAAFAEKVASGALELSRWEDPSLSDAQLEKEIRSVNGFGPYAAGTLGRLLGRHEALGLDSWTRKKVASLRFKGRSVKDARVARLYRGFGRFAGLAFWLDVTRDWHEDKESLWP